MKNALVRTKYLKEVWQNRFPSMGEKVPAGRLVAVSQDSLTVMSNGKAIHFELTPHWKVEADYVPWEVLVPGDIVAVEAQAKSVKLLVPTQGENPFPPSAFTPERAQQWQKFLKLAREFFEKREFIELRTPTLVPSPGLEPYLDPFETVVTQGSARTRTYLPTSPEFHLKKALTQGFERIFEFKECFRNNELSEHHQPEFLMLEWYRAYEDNRSLMADILELIPFLQKEFGEPSSAVQVITMEELWQKHLGFKLTPHTTVQDLAQITDGSADEGFDDLFARIFINRLEPALKEYPGPVILWHYPPSQAALARLTSGGWADRFELYWKGLEIANAFHELNDADEQFRRFKMDQEKKRRLNKEIVPIDDEFMKALRWGMPPSAGIALGLERLFMALFDIEKISDVRLFAR